MRPSPRASTALVILGAAVMTMFFLPWILAYSQSRHLWDPGSSGWTLMIGGFDGAAVRSLILVPVGGICMIAVGLTRRLPLVAAMSGAAVAAVVVWIIVRPLFPWDAGFAVAVVGAVLAIAGSLLEHRITRLVGGLAMALSYVLPWLGTTDLIHPRCPYAAPATLIPIGVLFGASLSVVSAIVPHRVARVLAWTGAAISIATVLVFTIANGNLAWSVWASAAAGICAVVIATPRVPRINARRVQLGV